MTDDIFLRFLSCAALFLIISGIVFGLPSNAAASQLGYCDQTDSTAAAVRCLKRRVDAEQKRLNEVYEKLGKTQSVEALETLKSLQKDWLLYRDGECEWEAAQAETSSLSQVNKLSCVAKLTEDRADVLSLVLSDAEQPGQPRQVGVFPRWMSALAKDNPNVFWDFANFTRGDFDCDGDDERAMTGVVLPASKTGEQTPFVIVALSENPPTGRPSSQLLTFPVQTIQKDETKDESIQPALCDTAVMLKVIEVDMPADKKDDSKPAACHTRLQVKDKSCPSIDLVWSGKTYQILSPEMPEGKDKSAAAKPPSTK